MAWETIDEDDIKNRLSGPELEAIRTYSKATGQSDPLTDVIALALTEVRGYIPICDRDSDATLIPPELKDVAILFTIEKLAGRVSGGALIMDEDRVRAYEIALQRLRDVGYGRFHIEIAGTDTTVTTNSSDGESLTGGNDRFAFGGETKLDF